MTAFMSIQIIKLLFLKLSGDLCKWRVGLKSENRNRLEKLLLVSLVSISNSFSFLIVRCYKTTFLQILVCRDVLQRFANVLFCAVWFLCLNAGGEKQNKFPRTAPTYQRSVNPVKKFYIIISESLYDGNVSIFGILHL